MAQALIPAAVGAALGVVAGNLLPSRCWPRPRRSTARSTLTVAPWVDVAVLAGALALVAVTAWAAAAGPGGCAPSTRSPSGARPARPRPVGGPAGRAAAAAPAGDPRPGPPVRAPARAAAIVAAIAFGAAAVTFAVGLASSLNQVQVAADHDSADVIVDSFEGGGPPA